MARRLTKKERRRTVPWMVLLLQIGTGFWYNCRVTEAASIQYRQVKWKIHSMDQTRARRFEGERRSEWRASFSPAARSTCSTGVFRIMRFLSPKRPETKKAHLSPSLPFVMREGGKQASTWTGFDVCGTTIVFSGGQSEPNVRGRHKQCQENCEEPENHECAEPNEDSAAAFVTVH